MTPSPAISASVVRFTGNCVYSLLDATEIRCRLGSMWTRTLLLAMCEHGVCHGQWVSSLQDTHTDGYAVRRYELTRLREMFIVTFNAFALFFST